MDDESTDESVTICDEFEKVNSKGRVIHKNWWIK